ncbi:MAG TPA: hypothetical protein PLU49_11740, partial [Saprospiraceae bacterium]|nr:hypothetical protein [Saprospiraceae bacterium]
LIECFYTHDSTLIRKTLEFDGQDTIFIFDQGTKKALFGKTEQKKLFNQDLKRATCCSISVPERL